MRHLPQGEQHKAPRGGKTGTPENRTSCRFRQPGHAYPNPCSLSAEHPSPTLPTREGEQPVFQAEKQDSKGKTAVPLRYMPQAASTSRPGKVPGTRRNSPPAAFETRPKGWGAAPPKNTPKACKTRRPPQPPKIHGLRRRLAGRPRRETANYLFIC